MLAGDSLKAAPQGNEKDHRVAARGEREAQDLSESTFCGFNIVLLCDTCQALQVLFPPFGYPLAKEAYDALPCDH